MTTFQMRRGTSTQWSAANSILASGEIGFDTTLKKMKVGDGVTGWNALAFADAAKADTASPTFTGTVTGITKAMVGLGNVDNTSDINKPVSTATSTAISNVGQSTVGGNTVMRRDVNGNTNIADPTMPSHAVTKRYVDLIPGAKIWPTFLGNKVAFIGDSYSSGYGLTNPTTERWTKIFCNYAGVSEYYNGAVPSSGYVNQGSGGNSKFSTQASLLPPDCSTVIMLGGINDAPLAQTDAQMATAVNAAITAIQAYSPSAQIIIISPMWHAGLPSVDLLKVERQIRAAIPAGVTFIERGPWLRIDRVEWQIFDGHPNAAGAIALASWVAAQLGYSPMGATQCNILPGGTADVALNQTNFPSWILAQDTIWNAKPGWWEYKAMLVMYNSSVNGNLWVQENNSRKVSVRTDQTSTLPTPTHRIETEFWHPGGDLTFRFGYDPNNTNMMVITNGQTKAYAKWLGVN